ncbi:response regulator transcription factor [Streptomyces sp. HNM0645]|uniref:response regulator transcription factor n=1 Tax=Streptomyces sp. HNM0645 TaxID=2782343 RepID=UPI0024B6EB12|nr:response regulator transcription factor [Streptomyces sp. HNM0645]MDI9884290.1 response regulator transcription factor [Streptomyces sp. HNM0645]
MIRVLLVHDSCLMRSALTALLGREHDLEVSESSWRAAVGQVRSLQPHVCIVDVECPGAAMLGSLIGRLRRATGSAAALLVLATGTRPGLLRRAFDAGALGYVSKDAGPQRLLDGIRQVAAGERFVDESLAFGFLQAAEMPLTSRELSVLRMAAEGATIAEIARGLHLSHGTVRNYMSAITRKTGARNRVDAIRISQHAGWV